MNIEKIIRRGAWAVPVVVALSFVGLPVVNVSTGHVGIDLFFGKVVGTREAGLSLKAPWIDVVEINTKAKPLEFPAEAPTHDLQLVHLKVNSQYSITASGAEKLYEAFGDEDMIESAVLNPGIQEVTKAISARYDAYDLQQKRDQIAIESRDAMRTWINASLGLRDVPNAIDFATLLFPQVDFSDKFNAATQEQTTQEQQVPTKEKERDTRVTNAKATAAATIRNANAQATKIRLSADAEADGIIAKAKALREHPDLLCYMVHKSWDGVMPDVTAVSNPLPFIESCIKH
jgi:regulator of protease activity HflC (stomatin/prohibitin superfamily)